MCFDDSEGAARPLNGAGNLDINEIHIHMLDSVLLHGIDLLTE